MENEIIDISLYKKYVGIFDMDIFGPDGIYPISGSQCVVIAQNLETAKMTLIYEMLHQCMLEGMPLRSLTLTSVYDPETKEYDHIIKLPSKQ